MRTDDRGALDRDEFGDDVDNLVGDGPVADAGGVDGVAVATESLDEDFLDADLGERDEFIAVEDDDEIDDDLIDADADDEDEYQVLMLQELGIDLDAPDALAPDLALDLALVDDDSDDGVAA